MAVAAFGFFFSNAGAAANYQVEVDKKTNRLYLYKDGSLVKEYRVATGRTEDLTPEGTFPMVVKINLPGWKDIPGGDPRNPLGEKWMGLTVNGDNGRTYGIHGTNQPNSIGTHASSGCIRMGAEDLRELYGTIPEGTPVWIHNGRHTGKWEGDPSFAVQPMSGKIKVTVNLANLRTGPSLGAFIITQLKTGHVLEVTGQIQDWYRVNHNGKTGFIHQSTVQKTSDHANTPPADSFKQASGMIEITASIANVRSDASLSAPIVQKASKGTKLTLTGENSEWFRVRLATGYTAYVHKTVAQSLKAAPPATKKVTVFVNLANIRSAPSQSATIIMRVAKGTTIEKVGTNGEWHIVKLSGGRTGFIHNSVAK
ncbi:SH3 domain-containing protein [Staphylospora marina]|uniref:SH3 domain-containing protein n=1 Tax=Staphylospora marina TaxID=2490858 RepID=UPI000F5C080F|nr:SH3 domain-containing protein [Staphylospora marina]